MVDQHDTLHLPGDEVIHAADGSIDLVLSEGLQHRADFERALSRGDNLLSQAPVAGGLTVEDARREQELTDWWERRAAADVGNLIPKAKARGGNDMYEVGLAMTQIMFEDPEEDCPWKTRGEIVELGLWFYIIGKMARAKAALERGRAPDDDTIKDLRIYMRMIQRVREVGNWPWPL